MSQQMSAFARSVFELRYAHQKGDRKETWEETATRVVETVFAAVDAPKELVEETLQFVKERIIMPGGRYLYATGNAFHQTQNCLLLRASDSREGWSEIMGKSTQALMTGAGIGIVYSDLRPKGALIRKTGGVASGPCALMEMVNEAGRFIRQGGARRSAIWAGLHWDHDDAMDFVAMKNWPEEIRKAKEADYDARAPMDGTNISIILDDRFFRAFHDEEHRAHAQARKVYWAVINQMLRTAEPGFSVDVGKNRHENCRNACTELTSCDTDDICNLGSINMARISSLEEMGRAVECATALLLAGTVYSDVPYPDVDRVRTKNRRLGLGLMGVHEFLLQRGKKYGPDDELAGYMQIYAESTHIAHRYARRWRLTKPVKTRAIAPTGTIGIVAQSSTGIEPIFCVAYKRRYLENEELKFQYVVDPTAKALIDKGANPDSIEDAYTLAEDVERRVAFQAWMQQYVDHAISSTINLPPWGSDLNNESRVRSFGNMLMRYLPKLRGITCYPDGCRGGQPLTRVRYETAMKHEGEIFVEQADSCDITKGGSCGA